MSQYLRKLTHVNGHPTLRALAEIEWHGILIRGMKLEHFPKGGWKVLPPGRLCQGQWQTILVIDDPAVQKCLVDMVLPRYLGIEAPYAA